MKKGAKFDELAKKYSKDKAVDLGYFTEEMMVPEFGKAVFAMKKDRFRRLRSKPSSVITLFRLTMSATANRCR